MKLIEKKCPNCGAGLEFDDEAKTCKCQYCKRSFAIERDMNDIDKFNLIYDKIHEPFKTVMMIPIIGAFVIISMIILFMSYNVRTGNDVSKNNNNKTEKIKETEKLITNVNDLSNRDYDTIDSQATTEINGTGEGVNDAYHSYSINGKKTREKLYVIYKKGNNYIIPVYKVTYSDFFHQENQYTVYVPIIFENITKNLYSSLGNPKLSAPEFYFNDEHTSYTYGYGSMDDVYNDLIKQYEGEYTISEK